MVAHGAGVPAPGQRVHAAAQRGRHPLHADRAAGHVDDRGRAACCSRWIASSRSFPEVVSVFGKMGRARTATDPAPLRHGRDHRRAQAARRSGAPGMTWDELIHEMDEKLQYPGHAQRLVDADPDPHRDAGHRHPQPARHQGVRRRPGDASRRPRSPSRRRSARIPGTRSAFAERSTGGFYVDVAGQARRRRPATGCRVADVNERGHDRHRRHGRVARRSRAASATRSTCATPASSATTRRGSGNVLVDTPSGAQIPISAGRRPSHFVTGPPMIRSEDGKLVGFVFVDTDRPIADYVARRQEGGGQPGRAAAPGRGSAWAGQFKYLERAKARLRLVRADHAGPHHPAAVPQHPLGHRDRHRPAGGAVLAGRRDLAALPARTTT